MSSKSYSLFLSSEFVELSNFQELTSSSESYTTSDRPLYIPWFKAPPYNTLQYMDSLVGFFKNILPQVESVNILER